MASFLLKLNSILKPSMVQTATPMVEQVRTTMKVRYYLKFHSETKRYRKKCWNKCIATPGRKDEIFRKMLKGERILCQPGYP